MRPVYRAFALAGMTVLAVFGCGDSPTAPQPQPGTLRVALTMPPANSGLDGAILFQVSGPAAPTAAVAGALFQLFHQPLATTTTYVVTGGLTPGAVIVSLDVPDVRQTYTGTIVQVAATDYQLRTLTGYSLVVMP